jgi:hypothetical protein
MNTARKLPAVSCESLPGPSYPGPAETVRETFPLRAIVRLHALPVSVAGMSFGWKPNRCASMATGARRGQPWPGPSRWSRVVMTPISVHQDSGSRAWVWLQLAQSYFPFLGAPKLREPCLNRLQLTTPLFRSPTGSYMSAQRASLGQNRIAPASSTL